MIEIFEYLQHFQRQVEIFKKHVNTGISSFHNTGFAECLPYIKKGIIYFDGQSHPLKPFIAEAIDRNNRIAMVEMFRPATESERDLLCKIFNVSRTDLVDISPERTHYYTDAVNRLREIFNDETVTSIRSRLHEEGFTIRQEEDVTYAINFKQHIIINLTEENFNLKR